MITLLRILWVALFVAGVVVLFMGAYGAIHPDHPFEFFFLTIVCLAFLCAIAPVLSKDTP